MQSRVVIGAPNRRVGLATVKMYITAVVDLYNKQALADPHSHRNQCLAQYHPLHHRMPPDPSRR